MEPSICSSIGRFISTAYSIGSSLTMGSMKPFTISLGGLVLGDPAGHEVEALLLADLGDRRLVADADVVLADADRRVRVRPAPLIEQERVADDRGLGARGALGDLEQAAVSTMPAVLGDGLGEDHRRRKAPRARSSRSRPRAGRCRRRRSRAPRRGRARPSGRRSGTSSRAWRRGCSRPTRRSRRSRRSHAW